MVVAYDVALAPHCPLGPIALASCFTVDAVTYNAFIQEQSMGIHYNVGKSVLDYVYNPEDFTFTDGYASFSTRPGLGVEVNRDLVLEENCTPHQWKNPVWRHADGSVAEYDNEIRRGRQPPQPSSSPVIILHFLLPISHTPESPARRKAHSPASPAGHSTPGFRKDWGSGSP